MNWLKVSGSLFVACALASCGGGGDVAGDTDEFFTNPSEIKWSTPEGNTSCKVGGGGGGETLVTIVGGTPPFRIHNPSPDSIGLDRTVVTGKDPVFKITTLGGCMEGVGVLVLDYHSRSTVVEVTVEEAAAEDAAAAE